MRTERLHVGCPGCPGGSVVIHRKSWTDSAGTARRSTWADEPATCSSGCSLPSVVVERLLSPGEYRNDQSPVMTLAQIDPLRVETFLPTAFYGQVKQADVAEVHPEEPVGGTYGARVAVVDRVMDAASGTFGVRLALPNPELRLPAGLKCKVRFSRTPAAG